MQIINIETIRHGDNVAPDTAQIKHYRIISIYQAQDLMNQSHIDTESWKPGVYFF